MADILFHQPGLNINGKMHACMLSCSVMSDSVTLWTVAHKTPLSMGFSRQEYWSRLLSPPPGDFPDLEIERGSPALADRLFTTAPPGKPKGKMDEPQTKGFREKFYGLWTQAELLCSSEKCDPELGREASWLPPWETQQSPCPSKWSAWKCKEMNPLACVLTFSLTAPAAMAIKRLSPRWGFHKTAAGVELEENRCSWVYPASL